MRNLRDHPFEPVLAELCLVIEIAVGAATAAVRIAELRAIAAANPAIAPTFLAEELRRWRSCATAVHAARLPHLREGGHV